MQIMQSHMQEYILYYGHIDRKMEIIFGIHYIKRLKKIESNMANVLTLSSANIILRQLVRKIIKSEKEKKKLLLPVAMKDL